MATPEERIKALEDVVAQVIDKLEEQAKELESVKKTTVKKSAGLFGGKRERTAIKDITTGKIYPSKASVGKSLAGEAGADPLDHFAWYKLMAKFPDRFVSATDEEAKAVWKAEADRVAKEVEESNQRLQAEQAVKDKAAADQAAKDKAATAEATKGKK